MKKLFASLLMISSSLASAQELHTFSNGEVADAEKINENFGTIWGGLDTLYDPIETRQNKQWHRTQIDVDCNEDSFAFQTAFNESLNKDRLLFALEGTCLFDTRLDIAARFISISGALDSNDSALCANPRPKLVTGVGVNSETDQTRIFVNNNGALILNCLQLGSNDRADGSVGVWAYANSLIRMDRTVDAPGEMAVTLRNGSLFRYLGYTSGQGFQGNLYSNMGRTELLGDNHRIFWLELKNGSIFNCFNCAGDILNGEILGGSSIHTKTGLGNFYISNLGLEYGSNIYAQEPLGGGVLELSGAFSLPPRDRSRTIYVSADQTIEAVSTPPQAPKYDSLPLLHEAAYGSVNLSSSGDSLVMGHFLDESQQTNEVLVFDRVANGVWEQRGETQFVDRFAQEVDISGDGTTIIAGDPIAASKRGKGFVFSWRGGEWQLRGDSFTGETGSDLMRGVSINEDGTKISLDEFQFANNREGRVRVWAWDESSWSVDLSVVGTQGQRVQYPSLSGDGLQLAVGSAPVDSGTPFARVMSKSPDGWYQKGADLSISVDDKVGIKPSISDDGNRVLLVTMNDSMGVLGCEVAVANYTRFGEWIVGEPIVLGLFDSSASRASAKGFDSCQGAISGDGDTIIVSNSSYSTDDNENSGKVWIFDVDPTQGGLVLQTKHEITGDSDMRLGSRVAINTDGSVFAYSKKGEIRVGSY